MPRKTQEQPDVPPFEFRPGVGLPPIGGMYRRGDPAQIPSHRLHLGVNIRLANGETGDRPGLTYVEGQSEQACITGIFEIEDFAVAVYITQLADGGLDGTGNKITSTYQILAFNEEKDPVSQNFWDNDYAGGTLIKRIPSPWRTEWTEGAFNTFQPFNDILLLLNGNQIYQVEFSEDDQVPRMDLTELFTLPGSASARSSCVRSERVDDPQTGDAFSKDVLYIGGTGGQIYRYDGTTVELVHTSTAGGWMQVIAWKGLGLVAAGTLGFAYQEQAGYSWQEQAWGQDFICNGLTEFLGQVVFVGHWDDVLGQGKYGAYAMRWPGSGAPIVFHEDVPPTINDGDVMYRTPVVAGGALHWIELADENVQPPVSGGLLRATDFATVTPDWGETGGVDPGFFIPYAGGLLMHSLGAGPASGWVAGNNIVYILSGPTVTHQHVYNWPEDASSQPPLSGYGWEAIPL